MSEKWIIVYYKHNKVKKLVGLYGTCGSFDNVSLKISEVCNKRIVHCYSGNHRNYGYVANFNLQALVKLCSSGESFLEVLGVSWYVVPGRAL